MSTKIEAGAFFRISDNPSVFVDRFDAKRGLTKAVEVDGTNFRKVQAVLLGTQETVIAVGTLRRGPRITTFERRLKVDDIKVFEPLLIADLVAKLGERHKLHAKRVFGADLGLFPPGTWKSLMDVLLTDYPHIASAIERATSEPHEPYWLSSDHNREVLALERDAITLALKLSGLEAKVGSEWEAPSAPAHFLEGLDPIPVREDQIIQHDLGVFGGWTRLRTYVGTFVEFKDRQNRLVVINANRTPLEATLGVDLIYYQAGYNSFVMVQYKRMRREDHGRRAQYVYRPKSDSNLMTELERMSALFQQASAATLTTEDRYRLNHHPAYIKMCRSDMELLSDSVSKGMYLPLEYFRWLLTSPTSRGPQGGVVISHETVPRHLSTTDFVGLVSSSWIGSSGRLSHSISSYIKEVVASGRSLTLAAYFPGEEFGRPHPRWSGPT
jgi:hypothetical protein